MCVCVLAAETRDEETQTSTHRRTCFHNDGSKHGGCGGHVDHADQAEEAIQG